MAGGDLETASGDAEAALACAGFSQHRTTAAAVTRRIASSPRTADKTIRADDGFAAANPGPSSPLKGRKSKSPTSEGGRSPVNGVGVRRFADLTFIVRQVPLLNRRSDRQHEGPFMAVAANSTSCPTAAIQSGGG